MLKFKNQVTLFVNYSYISFCDFVFPKLHIANRRICAKIWDFDFIWGLYMDIPLTDIHAIGPAIFTLYQWQLHWCLLNLLVKSHFKLSIILL